MTTVSGGATSERFEFVQRYRDLDVKFLCDWLGVSTNDFYAWQRRLFSKEIMDCEGNRVWFAEILMTVVATLAYIMHLRRFCPELKSSLNQLNGLRSSTTDYPEFFLPTPDLFSSGESLLDSVQTVNIILILRGPKIQKEIYPGPESFKSTYNESPAIWSAYQDWCGKPCAFYAQKY